MRGAGRAGGVKASGRFGFGLAYFSLALAGALLYTWPLALQMDSAFFGFPGDSLAGIWGFWWLDLSTSTGIPFRRPGLLAYPFGWDFSGTPLPYVFVANQYLFVKLFGAMAAFNLMKLLSLPLLALASYLLFHYLTGDRVASALMGAAYAFSPFHMIHLMAHFTNLWWLPLALLFLLKSLRQGGFANAALFGLFWGVLSVDNAYFGLFMGLIAPVAIFFHMDGLRRRGASRSLKEAFLALAVFSAALLPMAWPALKWLVEPSAAGVEARRLSDLFIFSAKPLDYLLPSAHNPFLGWLVPDLGIGPLKGHRYTEHTLYAGYAMLFLAGFGAWKALMRPGEGRRLALFLVFAAGLMLLISAPPFIPLGEFKIDTEARTVVAERALLLPQYLLFKALPSIRVYARAGGMALLALTALAAVGLALIRRNGGRPRLAAAVAAAFIAVEYAEVPSFRMTRLDTPQIYSALASMPGGFGVVEYPFGRHDDAYTTYEYMYHQRAHGKPLVNTPARGSLPPGFEEAVRDMGGSRAAEALRQAGVRFVVIHRGKYRSGNEYARLDWVTAPPREKIFPPKWGAEPGQPPAGMRLVASSGEDELYELAAAPAAAAQAGPAQ